MAARIIEDAEDLTIRVFRDAEGDLRLWDVSLEGRRLAHTIAFRKRDPVGQAFEPDLTALVSRAFQAFEAEPDKVHEWPDCSLELPGALLGALRVRQARSLPGKLVCRMRFRYFLGDLRSLFVHDTAPALAPWSHRERIAISALADIAGPLLGLARIGETLNENDAAEAVAEMRALATEASTLERHLDLLTRYALQLDMAAVERAMGLKAGGGVNVVSFRHRDDEA